MRLHGNFVATRSAKSKLLLTVRVSCDLTIYIVAGQMYSSVSKAFHCHYLKNSILFRHKTTKKILESPLFATVVLQVSKKAYLKSHCRNQPRKTTINFISTDPGLLFVTKRKASSDP